MGLNRGNNTLLEEGEYLRLRGFLHEPGLTGNPGSYINPGYKKLLSHGPGLPAISYSPDPGWLLCGADSFNVG